MTRNVMPYVIEWIFFHHLQGVDRFMIFDDKSDDDLHLLPKLLKAYDFPGMVEVIPANFLSQKNPRYDDISSHNSRQEDVLDFCRLRVTNTSEWVLVIDTDEFVYSTGEETILQLVEKIVEDSKKLDTEDFVTTFGFTAVRFGTSGTLYNMHGYVLRDNKGEIHLLYHPQPNSTVYPLTTETSNHRAPISELDDDFEAIHNKTCVSEPQRCIHAIGKAMFMPKYCTYSGIHYCRNLTKGHDHHFAITEARLAHYAWRSKENVEGYVGWQADKLTILNQYDKTWFSLRHDESAERYAETLRKTIVDNLTPVLLASEY